MACTASACFLCAALIAMLHSGEIINQQKTRCKISMNIKHICADQVWAVCPNMPVLFGRLCCIGISMCAQAMHFVILERCQGAGSGHRKGHRSPYIVRTEDHSPPGNHTVRTAS